MSLKSGATRGPAAVDAVALAHSALASNSCAAARRVADAHGGRRRIEAGADEATITPSSSAGRSTNGGMPVPGTPDVMTRARSSSDDERRKRPSFRSMPGTPSPFAPWQTWHCGPYSRWPASTSARLY